MVRTVSPTVEGYEECPDAQCGICKDCTYKDCDTTGYTLVSTFSSADSCGAGKELVTKTCTPEEGVPTCPEKLYEKCDTCIYETCPSNGSIWYNKGKCGTITDANYDCGEGKVLVELDPLISSQDGCSNVASTVIKTYECKACNYQCEDSKQ